MKKRAFVFILIICILIICLASCSNDPISSPVLKFDKNTKVLSWDKVNSAVGYQVFMYTTDLSSEVYEGYPITVTECALNLTREGKYFVSVRALAKNDKRNSAAVAIEVEVINKTGGETGNVPDDNEVSNIFENQYFLKGSQDDYIINVEEGFEIEEVYSTINDTDFWQISNDNTLKIKSSYLNKFDSGARIEIFYKIADANGVTELCKNQVFIVNKMPNTIKNLNEKEYFEYDISNPKYVNIKLTNNYSVTNTDIVAVVVDNTVLSKGKYKDYTVDVTTNEQNINFNSKVLNRLKTGIVDVYIVTSYGTLYTKIFVYSQDYTPVNIYVDPDSNYPNIYLKWDSAGNNIDNYIVDINSNRYSKSEYPHLFGENTFNLTNLYDERTTLTLSAVVGGVEYTSDVVTVLNYSKYADYLSYDNGFYYLGTDYNSYIFTQKEFNTLSYYLLMNFSEIAYVENGEKRASINIKLDSQEFLVICDSSGKSSETASRLPTMLRDAIRTFAEGYMFSSGDVSQIYLVEDLGYGAFRITIRNLLSTSIPYDSISSETLSKYSEESSQLLQTTLSRESDFEAFAINKREKFAAVTTSEELYMAVELGFKPSPTANSSAERIYDEAKKVLRKIVNDQMSDYMKYVSIFEWVAKNVVYDYDSLQKSNSLIGTDEYATLYAYRCFYLEGVFIDKLAVCNGLSKAISLMCNMEGIDCNKIIGADNKGGAHAWNKVKIDGIWYVSDITWANVLHKSQGIEYLSHEYMLMSESVSNVNRVETASRGLGDYVYATENFDYYTTTTYYHNGKLIDRYVTNDEELKELCEYVATNSIQSGNITFDIKCASGYVPSEALVTDSSLMLDRFKSSNNVYFIKISRR